MMPQNVLWRGRIAHKQLAGGRGAAGRGAVIRRLRITSRAGSDGLHVAGASNRRAIRDVIALVSAGAFIEVAQPKEEWLVNRSRIGVERDGIGSVGAKVCLVG